MIIKRVLLCAVVAMLLATGVAAADPIKDQVNCYTTWDDAYLYLAFKVDCPDVQANNNKPNVDLTGDDMVEFYIETDNKHSEKITPACFSMGVSAAGGSQFRSGTENGDWLMAPVFTFKYGATVQGTLNNPDDIDTTYNIEMAVPWGLLKTKAPSLGGMMSFNVIVRRHNDPKGFISLSPRVKSEDDAHIPANWSRLVFAAHSFGVATLNRDKILSAKYVVRAPLIDGLISDKEWHQNTSIAIDLPMPPGFVYEAKYPVQRMALARYSYWYQADSRKQAPVQRIRKPDGTIELADPPAGGIGPWFSYDRVQWHKDELSSMIASGFMVALPDYLAAASVDKGAADKGLDCMVAALDELRKEGKPFPMVGMYLDCSYIKVGAQSLLSVYGAIKDFYNRIPAEYRVVAPAGKPTAGQPGNIICLANAGSLDMWSAGFVNGCTERFTKDFGAPLIWLADSSFASKAAVLDAVSDDPDSRISLGWITADDSYNSQWDDVIEANPMWVVCDAWNDYSSGKCVVATAKLGVTRVESTKAFVKRFNAPRDYSAQFLRYDLPDVISPKQIAQAQVTIRNIGNTTWRAKSGYALGYRWYRSGRFFGESKIRRPLEKDVAPGETVTVNIGIATVTSTGTPLPEGPCELRLDVMRASDGKWFSALGDTPTMLPVNIGPQQDLAATLLSASAPNMIAVGAAYPVTVKIRNDGTQNLRSSNTRIECSLYKVSRVNPDALAEKVEIAVQRKNLPKDCKPGEIIDVPMQLTIAAPSKKTLDLSSLGADWTYQLRFDVVRDSIQLSESGTSTLNRAIEIRGADYGQRIVDSDIPLIVAPNKKIDAKVVLRNTGIKPWDAKKSSIGYHWYNINGDEVQWDGVMSPIKTTVGPAAAVVLSAAVQTPATEGKYVLVWDLNIDNKWLSTEPLSKGGDILAVPVEVSKDADSPAHAAAADGAK